MGTSKFPDRSSNTPKYNPMIDATKMYNLVIGWTKPNAIEEPTKPTPISTGPTSPGAPDNHCINQPRNSNSSPTPAHTLINNSSTGPSFNNSFSIPSSLNFSSLRTDSRGSRRSTAIINSIGIAASVP